MRLRKPRLMLRELFGTELSRVVLAQPHEVQQKIIDLINDPAITHLVLIVGRRVGKSFVLTGTSPCAIDAAVYDGQKIGMFSPVAADLEPVWLAMKENFKDHITHSDSTKRSARFASSGLIEFWSLPNMGAKENARGRNYFITVYEETQKFADPVIDHHFNKVSNVWRADVKHSKIIFIGTANGIGSYWHKLCMRGVQTGLSRGVIHNNDIADLREAGNVLTGFEKWCTVRFPIEANPHLDAETVADLRKTMDALTAAQEMDCKFVRIGGQMWCHALKSAEIQNRVLVDTLPIDWRDTLYFSFDFNKRPQSCTLMQLPRRTIRAGDMWKANVHIVKEFTTPPGEKATIYDLLREIVTFVHRETGRKIGKWYPGNWDVSRAPTGSYPVSPFRVVVTGDATGRDGGSGNQRVPEDYYQIIARELNLNFDNQIRLETTNLPHRESHVQMNTIFEKHDGFFVNQITCPLLVNDFFQTISLPDSRIDKKAYDPHKLDSLRYNVNTNRYAITSAF